MKAVVGYANNLDNILPIPQDPHYTPEVCTPQPEHATYRRGGLGLANPNPHSAGGTLPVEVACVSLEVGAV